jgi:adenosylhomocysteine nucleosidase
MPESLIDQRHQSLEVGFQMDPAVVQATPHLHVGRLLSLDQLVRDRQKKEVLATEHGAIAYDMETFAVAQVCRNENVRFLAVRVVSDQLDEQLPAEVEHMLGQQSVAGKLGAATGALFRRPGSVKDMWKLRETATQASDRLARFLEGVLPQLEQ